MTAHDAPERLSGYAKLCIALLVALGFSLGCSEFIVIGIQPEIARNYDVAPSKPPCCSPCGSSAPSCRGPSS